MIPFDWQEFDRAAGGYAKDSDANRDMMGETVEIVAGVYAGASGTVRGVADSLLWVQTDPDRTRCVVVDLGEISSTPAENWYEAGREMAEEAREETLLRYTEVVAYFALAPELSQAKNTEAVCEVACAFADVRFERCGY